MGVRAFLEQMGGLTVQPQPAKQPLGDFFKGLAGIVDQPDPQQQDDDMTQKTINAALDKVSGIEGGYVNDPVDRGGETNHGITLKFLQSVQPGATSASLKALDKKQARVLFDQHFVKAPGLNKLPDVAQAEAVALSINAGPTRAIKVLQRAAGVEEDGRIGPGTIAAIKRLTNDQIKVAVDGYYHGIVKANPSQKRFLNGWLNRSAIVSSIPEDTSE